MPKVVLKSIVRLVFPVLSQGLVSGKIKLKRYLFFEKYGKDFIDNSRIINPRKHLNNSKLHLNLKGLAKLQDVLFDSIKNLILCWRCKRQSTILRKGCRVNYQHWKGFPSVYENTSKPFKEVLFVWRWDILNRVILAHLNTNSICNKFNLLTEGMTNNVDVIMILETRIDETFPAMQFHINGYKPPHKLEWDCNGGGILIM